MAEKKGTVVRQAAFLMAAQLICSVVGLLYRSPLHLIMGDVGDGYYTFAYEWYTIILLISSYSIPSAISKVMSERLAVGRYRSAQRVFYVSLGYVTVVGGIGALVAFFAGPVFLASQPDAVLALRVLSPTILFSGYLGCLRGYFQARNDMFPTGVSRVVEQIINAVMSVAAAWFLVQPYVNTGDENLIGKFGAAGGTVGTGSGVLAGILFMLFIYLKNAKRIRRDIKRDRTKKKESYRKVLNVIFMMVTPIIFATCIYNATAIVDQIIYNYAMAARGVNAVEASRQYALFGYRFKPIINIPVALSSATSTALIPAVAGAIANKDRRDAREKIDECMKLSTFLAVPSAVGLAILSYPVVRILYPTGDITGAAIILSMGSITVIAYSLSTVTNGVLQGLGHQGDPVRNAAKSLALNAVIAFVTVRYLGWGVRGILAATVVYSFCMMFLNARSIRKYLGYKHDLNRLIWQPFRAALVMGVVVAAIFWIPNVLWSGFDTYLALVGFTGLSVVAGVLVYIVVYTKTTGMTDAEMRRLPMGTKMLVILRKLHLR